MTDQIGIYDHATGETIVRDMTEDEQKAHDAEIALSIAKKAAEAQATADAVAAKEAALAKLAALGLDLDDLKALGF
jgi:hypothetical protein